MITIPGLFFFAVFVGLIFLFWRFWKTDKPRALLMGSVLGSFVVVLAMKRWGVSANTLVPTAFVLFVLCLVSFLVFKITQSRRAEKAWMDGTAGATLRHRTSTTGIAIDPVRELLFLQEGSAFKAFPFADLRGWEKIWLTAAANNHIRAQNRAGSGLFVKVRHIDHATWHIKFATSKELDRWFEILTQYVNEKDRT
jgi:hypothetical protein